MIDNRKYVFAFLITAAIFATALFVSNFFTQKRMAEIQNIENRVAQDILSSETQFSLLEETSCRDIKASFLSKSLGELAERLAFAETRAGFDEEEVLNLKKSYSLLQIKDYLLMKRVTEKCGSKPPFILYFYSTDETQCVDCIKTGYVLTALQEKYPDLRIYSFDYNLDLEAQKTLISIYKVRDTLPAMIINGDPYYGFRPLNELETSVPALQKLKADFEKAETLRKATTTATSTR